MELNKNQTSIVLQKVQQALAQENNFESAPSKQIKGTNNFYLLFFIFLYIFLVSPTSKAGGGLKKVMKNVKHVTRKESLPSLFVI